MRGTEAQELEQVNMGHQGGRPRLEGPPVHPPSSSPIPAPAPALVREATPAPALARVAIPGLVHNGARVRHPRPPITSSSTCSRRWVHPSPSWGPPESPLSRITGPRQRRSSPRDPMGRLWMMDHNRVRFQTHQQVDSFNYIS